MQARSSRSGRPVLSGDASQCSVEARGRRAWAHGRLVESARRLAPPLALLQMAPDPAEDRFQDHAPYSAAQSRPANARTSCNAARGPGLIKDFVRFVSVRRGHARPCRQRDIMNTSDRHSRSPALAAHPARLCPGVRLLLAGCAPQVHRQGHVADQGRAGRGHPARSPQPRGRCSTSSARPRRSPPSRTTRWYYIGSPLRDRRPSSTREHPGAATSLVVCLRRMNGLVGRDLEGLQSEGRRSDVESA